MSLFRVLQSPLLAALLAGCSHSGPRFSPWGDVRALPEKRQLMAAFAAVYDKDAPFWTDVGEVHGDVAPVELLWRDNRAILITKITGYTCHACVGAFGLHYLEPVGDHFRVTASFRVAVTGSGFGVAPENWSISNRFGPQEAIYSEAGWVGQGCKSRLFQLTEFRSGKPVIVATVRLNYDDREVNPEDPDFTRIDGKLGTIAPGKAFTVNYTGTRRFSETWTRRGDVYALPGETEVPQC